jgi:hypothetical protein
MGFLKTSKTQGMVAFKSLDGRPLSRTNLTFYIFKKDKRFNEGDITTEA